MVKANGKKTQSTQQAKEEEKESHTLTSRTRREQVSE